MNRSPAHWAVVPAAGAGLRVGGPRPKQYLDLAGRPVLQRTLEALLAFEELSAAAVVLAPDDAHWHSLPAAEHPKILATPGGVERCDSVLAGLQCLEARAHDDDWVMVHDAARPCLSRQHLRRLVDSLEEDPVGGLLAVPVVDTVKRAGADARVLETVSRSQLWLAQTPQMFRYGLLKEALKAALAEGVQITDEASALEWAGHCPRLVAGDVRNIKITHPGDLPLAERFFESVRETGE